MKCNPEKTMKWLAKKVESEIKEAELHKEAGAKKEEAKWEEPEEELEGHFDLPGPEDEVEDCLEAGEGALDEEAASMLKEAFQEIKDM